jgi:hypothetical protein
METVKAFFILIISLIISTIYRVHYITIYPANSWPSFLPRQSEVQATPCKIHAMFSPCLITANDHMFNCYAGSYDHISPSLICHKEAYVVNDHMINYEKFANCHCPSIPSVVVEGEAYCRC